MNAHGPNIGLVLGGGGIAGVAFHAAALAALEDETGFDARTAEIVVGTSAGAIAAAVLRGDVPAAEIRQSLLAGVDNPGTMPTLELLAGATPKAVPRVWAGPGAPGMAVRELRRGRSLRVSKLLAALLPRGRSPLTPIGEPLSLLHQSGWPSRAMWIPATDLRTGRLVVFGRSGSRPTAEATVAQAVAASAALPVFFAPVRIGRRSYIDGGIGSPFNADLLVDYPAPLRTDPEAPARTLDLVIVLAPLSVDEFNRRSPFSSAARSLPRRRLRAELRSIEAGGTPTLVFQPDRSVARAMGLNPMDPHRVRSTIESTDELIRRQLHTAPAATLDVLETAARCLESPPNVAHPAL